MTFQPETSFGKAEHGPALSESEQRVFDVLVPAMESARINPEDFTEYNPATIKENVEYVEKRQAEWETNPETRANKPAELAEAIIWNGINSDGWLGEEAISIVPSKFEDITKGVDNVVRFKTKTGVALALAIDVTESSREVDRKIDNIFGDIFAGKLTTLNYFESKSGHGIHYQGMLENIPKVVVASNRKSVSAVADRLAKLWELTEFAEKNPGLADKFQIEAVKKELSGSALKYKMLFEIREQLTVFSQFAKENNHPELSGPHEIVLALVNEVLDAALSKKRQEEVLEKIMEDEAVAEVFKKTRGGLKKLVVARPKK